MECSRAGARGRTFRIRFGFAAPLLALSLATLAASQDVLRVETRLVEVEVVVRDGDGPVSGLSRDDFLLYDDGVLQEISVFERRASSPPSELPLPEGAVSNLEERDAGGVTVLLFDEVNAGFEAQTRARQHAETFFESLDGETPVALYRLDSRGLSLIEDYTRDPEILRAALDGKSSGSPVERSVASQEGLTGGFGATEDEVGLDPRLVDRRRDDPMEASALELSRMAAEYYLDRSAALTSQALEELADLLAGVSGRKNLVWLSARFPFAFEPLSYFDPVREVRWGTQATMVGAGEALLRAGVAVYPIDALGLGEFSPPGTETMAEIAETTGGQAVLRTNGIADAIQDTVDDIGGTYLLGFYPRDGAENSEFHELRVEVRGDDFDVRHRAGYYGFQRQPYSPEEQKDLLRRLVLGPVSATGLGLVAVTEPLASGELETRVMADLRDLDLELQNGVWIGDVALAYFVVEEGSERVVARYNTARIRLDPGEYDQAMASGVVLIRQASHPGDRTLLRVAALEPRNNLSGSLWVPLGNAVTVRAQPPDD